MIRALLVLLLLVLAIKADATATYPTCANLGLGVACEGANTIGGILWEQGVNIRFFGAKGDGVQDDTAAIQAAIDFAANNNIQTVFCPSGDYKISGAGPAILYLDRPNNLRSNFNNPGLANFSLAFVGQGDAQGNNQGYGCRLLPTTDSNVAFIVGPGQSMTVKGIAIIGPNAATWRGNLSSTGIGLGISGGSAGASIVLIENVDVENFYTLYQTGAAGNGSLDDSNTFRKVNGTNCFYGIYFSATQNDINDIETPRLGCTNSIYSPDSRQATIIGGNLSPVSGKSVAATIGTVSALSTTADGNGFDYTFTGVISSPDVYWPNVYNSFVMVTAHFGAVPLTLKSWNAGTHTGTFQIVKNWAFANFPFINLATQTDLQAELQAVTTIYAAERVTTLLGQGISMEGVHVENPNACQTMFTALAGFNGATRSTIKNVYYNGDPALPTYAPGQTANTALNALFYCQAVFPFIEQASNGSSAQLELNGGDFSQTFIGSPLAPLLIQQLPDRFLTARRLSQVAPFNMAIGDNGFNGSNQIGSLGQIETQGQGAGEWDSWYFPPFATITGFSQGRFYMQDGKLTGPFYGYRAAPGVIPNLAPDIFAKVNPVTGALGSYPPIDCETVYRSVAPNSGALVHIFARSASCPGYSWSQNLTDTPVGGTVTWSYKGQSAMLYLDAKTILWMFPGMGFQLLGGTGDGSAGADSYVVTGVYPQLGYITAMDVTTNGPTQGAPLPGLKTSVFSCASTCTIKQAAYSWTQYP